MLKKKNRLAKTKDVKVVVSSGRSFFSPLFTIKYLPHKEQKIRFTVVVSTKVSKKAVVRNKIKRVIRESIRLNFRYFPAGDYAILVKPQAAKLEPQNLREKFEDLAAHSIRKLIP